MPAYPYDESLCLFSIEERLIIATRDEDLNEQRMTFFQGFILMFCKYVYGQHPHNDLICSTCKNRLCERSGLRLPDAHTKEYLSELIDPIRPIYKPDVYNSNIWRCWEVFAPTWREFLADPDIS